MAKGTALSNPDLHIHTSGPLPPPPQITRMSDLEAGAAFNEKKINFLDTFQKLNKLYELFIFHSPQKSMDMIIF